MKIVCISDTHGYLPDIEECDIFLHAGDICPTSNHTLPFQERWLLDNFNPWLETIKAKYKVITWGNHDFIGQEKPRLRWQLNCDVLVDEIQVYNGINIWGSPWTKKFFDWAFNMEPSNLYNLHKSIPECDIILTHGPVYGFGDLCRDMDDPEQLINVGSLGLLERIKEIKPQLVIGGHIHPGYGKYKLDTTDIYNVSYVDSRYRPKNNYTIYEI